MTVNTTAASVTYQGNGAGTDFPFDFQIPGSSDADQTNAQVTLVDTTVTPATTTVLTPDKWSISGVGQPGGGSVSYGVGAPLGFGQYLTIARVLSPIQDTSIPNQSAFYGSVVEAALDYLTMLVQQIQQGSNGVLRTLVSDPVPTLNPIPVSRANQWLGFGADSQPIVGVPAGVPVSVAMQPVVQAASLELAREAFGAGVTGDALFLAADPAAVIAALGDGAIPYASLAADAVGLMGERNSIVNPGMQIADNPGVVINAGWQWTPCTMWGAVAYNAANVSAGTLAQTGGSSFKSTFAVGSTNLTTINVGSILGLRTKIEARVAQKYVVRRASFSCVVFHTFGAPVDFWFQAYAPTAADNFGGLSAPMASPHTAVPSGVPTLIKWENVDLTQLGSPVSNGLMVEIDASFNGAKAGFSWMVGDVSLVPGAVAPASADILDISLEALRCRRYFSQLGGVAGVAQLAALGQVASATVADAMVAFVPAMRVAPSLSLSAATDWTVSDGSAGPSCTSIGFDGGVSSGPAMVGLLLTTTGGLTIGRACRVIGNNANAKIKFDATFGP